MEPKPPPDPKRLKKFTEAQLRAELDRRQKEEDEKRRQLHEAHAENVKATLTRAMVDVFRPHHDKKDCTDESPARNGFYEDHGSQPYCVRCGLLELLEGYDLPGNAEVRLHFT